MEQRVNIQYSIAIGDLELEVRRLIERTEARLTAVLDDFNTESAALSLDMAENIDSLRAELAQIDYGLNDVSKIIMGYVSYRTQSMSPPEKSPGAAPPEDWGRKVIYDNGMEEGDSKASLTEAIKEFKEAMIPHEKSP